MPRKGHSEEQIVAALQQAEAGEKVTDICRKLSISQATFYAWKKQYAGLAIAELRELRQLRDENSRLKRLILTCASGLVTPVLAAARSWGIQCSGSSRSPRDRKHQHISKITVARDDLRAPYLRAIWYGFGFKASRLKPFTPRWQPGSYCLKPDDEPTRIV